MAGHMIDGEFSIDVRTMDVARSGDRTSPDRGMVKPAETASVASYVW